ncbi:exonuclease SbcCD subunit D [Chryseomicrobium palamuruense]|uniref:Exonuclease SbcCD subunit D n=1 Tax=Chryseomicrobium palamuruense TaxID=682973 RepID=A0ABV8UQP9_9BACL
MTIHFFHAADLHLGSPFKGLQQIPEDWRERLSLASYLAFDRLIEDAERKRPDFIVFAGDIYDGENRSLHAQYRFQEGLKRLSASNIPVYIIHGNHDHLAGRWTRFDYPHNVTVFQEVPHTHILKLSHATVQLTGFSYAERHIQGAVIGKFPERQSEVDYAIGLLHGSEASQKEHDVYAPFSILELQSKNYDYWALGHIHKRQILTENPPIVYSGTLQGRNRKERGEQGYLEVKLQGKSAELTFCPVSTVRFEQVEIDGTEVRTMDELLECILSQVTDLSGYCVIDCSLLLKKGDWLQVESDELYTFLNEKLTDLSTHHFFNRMTIQWQQDMPSPFKQLLQSTEVTRLSVGLTTYLPERNEWEQSVREKLQALLQERGNGQ